MKPIWQILGFPFRLVWAIIGTLLAFTFNLFSRRVKLAVNWRKAWNYILGR